MKYKPLKFESITFYDGSSLTSAELSAARSGTAEYEIALLIFSDSITKWSEKLERSIYRGLNQINNHSIYAETELEVTDVKTIGCKFTISAVESFMGGRASAAQVEHCWSLSNSCGELINPNDTARFIQLVFKDKAVTEQAQVNTSGSVSDYLVYCLQLYDNSKKKSNAGRTQLMESYVSFIRDFFQHSDLYYRSPLDNPLLTGVLYDLCIEHNVLRGSYLKNLDNFRLFKQTYLPMIDDIFDYSWELYAPDERLLFPIEPYEIIKEVPTMSVIDANVVLSNKLVYLDSYLENNSILALEKKIISILCRDNEGTDEGALWAAFFCYYGTYRTARQRVVKRPDTYELDGIFSKPIVMSGVELFFDELQKRIPDVSLRRRFNGAKAGEAIAVFKKLGISFPPITRLNVPSKYSYLNIDYFKQANCLGLTEEEKIILSNIAKDVDMMCAERISSVKGKPIAQRNGKAINSAKIRTLPTNTLVRDLWKNASSTRRRVGGTQR